jgi:hypothetical protein
MQVIVGKQIHRLLQMGLIPLLLLVWLAVPATTRAAGSQDFKFAGEWEITFEIVNGKINADWIGRVWDYRGVEPVIMAHQRVDISPDCEIVGEPVFGEDDVTLDGVDDYIRCQIPNYPAIFYEMTKAVTNELIRCRCYYEGPPYVAADVTPDYSTLEQPVVYHDRLYLEVVHQDVKGLRLPVIKTDESVSWWQRAGVRMDANNSLAVAKLNLQFLNDEVQTWQSNRFNLWQNNGYQIWAGYDAARYAANTDPTGFAKFLNDAGFWDEVQPDYVDGFFMWESEAPQSYTDVPMPSGFGLAAQSFIYIGHNPELGTFYHGTMRAVAVDPGCRGH